MEGTPPRGLKSVEASRQLATLRGGLQSDPGKQLCLL
jgi:hypothetical protein